jgi:phage gp36-like protein
MPNYFELSDLKSALSEEILLDLTDEKGEGQISEKKVAYFRGRAENLVNGFVRGNPDIPFPFTTIPPLIRDLAVEAARIDLLKARYLTDLPESLLKDEELLLRKLTNLQSGRINLGLGAGDFTKTTEFRINKTATNRVFTNTELAKW